MQGVNGTSIGIVMGLCACAYYVYRGHKTRAYNPNLAAAANLLLGCVGLPAGIQSGYLALTATPEELGVFKDQTIAVALGSIAVVWVSVQQIAQIIPLPIMGFGGLSGTSESS